MIVARAFPPRAADLEARREAVRPASTPSTGRTSPGSRPATPTRSPQGARISGVAPRAYLGNYKALTIPTDADVGLDGNSPELVAAIEAAVEDGMDVINMSLGEPEIEPSRDIVVQALGAAARAGVVPVIAAGNDFDDFGRGSVSSPGSTPEAITVGAVTTTRSGTRRRRRVVLLERPDPALAAPEAGGQRAGRRASSRPAPAARTRRSPGRAWPRRTSPARPRSCCSGIRPGRPRRSSRRSRRPATTPSPTTRSTAELDRPRAAAGSNLPRADNPLLFAAPAALSFGLVGPGARR